MPGQAVIHGAAVEIPVLMDVLRGFPNEQHNLRTNTFGGPVEQGKSMQFREATDHATALAEELVLEAIVSRLHGEDPEAAWGALRELHARRATFSVTTEWGSYSDCVFREIDAVKQGDGMRLTLRIERQIIVGVVDSELPAANIGGPATGRSGVVNRGRVNLESP